MKQTTESRDASGGLEKTLHDRATDRETTRPYGYGTAATRTDVLSQILTLIRLRGELVYTARLRAPWSIAFPTGPASFYFVESGTIWVKAPGEEPMAFNQGDMLLLLHGAGHTVYVDPAAHPIPIDKLIGKHFDRAKSLLDYGGSGPSVGVIAGLFHVEGESLAAIIASLPFIVHIPSLDRKTPEWLHALTHFLVKETNEAEPGSALMISRLIDLLVIRTLRSWAATQQRPLGWVGALKDERVSQALNAVHASPYAHWTVENMAGLATMSRSIFTERFTKLVGEAPLQYVKRLKLTLAADMLASDSVRVNQAAARIGYASDAAFSRAFKAQFGYPPSEASRRLGKAGINPVRTIGKLPE